MDAGKAARIGRAGGWWESFWSWSGGLAFAAAVGHVFCNRLAWREIPLQTDTGMWAYIAGRILEGAIPYRDLWESKPPGIYYLFALVEWVFGTGGDTALLWLDAVISLAVIGITYTIARGAAGRCAASLAMLPLSLVFCHRELADWGCNVEKFAALLEIAAISIACADLDGRAGRGRWLLAGMLSGSACLFKQTGVIALLALAANLGWAIGRQRDGNALAARRLGMLLLGAGLVAAGTTIAILMLGAWRAFWEQVVIYDLLRVGSARAERGRILTAEHWDYALAQFQRAAILLLPAGACLLHRATSCAWGRPESAGMSATPPPSLMPVCALHCVLIAVLFAVAPHGYGHYLLQGAPTAAILAAWHVEKALRSPHRPAAAFWLALLMGTGAMWLGDHLRFTFRPEYEFRQAYGQRRQRMDAIVAAIRERTAPGQVVMLWPPDYAISYYTQRRTPLEASNADVLFKGKGYRLSPRPEVLLEQLRRSPPDVIVDITGVRAFRTASGEFEVELEAPYSLLMKLAEAENSPDDRILRPFKQWIRSSFGGQVWAGGVVFYWRDRPPRPAADLLAEIAGGQGVTTSSKS